MAKMGKLRNGGTASHWTVMFQAPRCGAKAKSTGEPCQKPAIKGRRRCQLHGGRSYGPKTAEGKQRVIEANTKHGQCTLDAERERAELRKRLRGMGIKAAPRGRIPDRDRATGRFRKEPGFRVIVGPPRS